MWGTNKQKSENVAPRPRGNLAFTALSYLCPSTPDLNCYSKFDFKGREQSKINMPTTLKEFESVWPRIVTDLQNHCKGYKLPQQSLDWFTKVLP